MIQKWGIFYFSCNLCQGKPKLFEAICERRVGKLITLTSITQWNVSDIKLLREVPPTAVMVAERLFPPDPFREGNHLKCWVGNSLKLSFSLFILLTKIVCEPFWATNLTLETNLGSPISEIFTQFLRKMRPLFPHLWNIRPIPSKDETLLPPSLTYSPNSFERWDGTSSVTEPCYPNLVLVSAKRCIGWFRCHSDI